MKKIISLPSIKINQLIDFYNDVQRLNDSLTMVDVIKYNNSMRKVFQILIKNKNLTEKYFRRTHLLISFMNQIIYNNMNKYITTDDTHKLISKETKDVLITVEKDITQLLKPISFQKNCPQLIKKNVIRITKSNTTDEYLIALCLDEISPCLKKFYEEKFSLIERLSDNIDYFSRVEEMQQELEKKYLERYIKKSENCFKPCLIM